MNFKKITKKKEERNKNSKGIWDELSRNHFIEIENIQDKRLKGKLKISTKIFLVYSQLVDGTRSYSIFQP